MPIKMLGAAKDQRTDTNVIYAKVPISEYLSLVGDDFDSFNIQRKKEKHKAYERLKDDIIKGALLPSITLAVKPDYIDEIEINLNNMKFNEIERILGRPGQVQILDGVQRTHILKELSKSSTTFMPMQSLLLEFWLEKKAQNLIYRIIVLNAGRKPMSMRHQVELLFLVIQKTIEDRINDLELYRETEQTRRRGARKYALDRIAAAYNCYLSKVLQGIPWVNHHGINSSLPQKNRILLR
jgi:hypothetical protein